MSELNLCFEQCDAGKRSGPVTTVASSQLAMSLDTLLQTALNNWPQESQNWCARADRGLTAPSKGSCNSRTRCMAIRHIRRA